VWKEQAKFMEHADKMQAEVAKLNAAAKTGNLDNLKTAFGPAAQSCKAATTLPQPLRRRGWCQATGARPLLCAHKKASTGAGFLHGGKNRAREGCAARLAGFRLGQQLLDQLVQLGKVGAPI
jgi:hypothetical protein